MKDKIKGVDMDAVMDYMIKNDCRLDEAIAAVSGEPVGKPDKLPKTKISENKRVSVKKPEKVSDRPKTKIKAARLAAGLSQNELALKADLNLRTLQAYEQGYKSFDNARLDVIFRVALLCECRLEDLIENPDLLELIKKYEA